MASLQLSTLVGVIGMITRMQSWVAGVIVAALAMERSVAPRRPSWSSTRRRSARSGSSRRSRRRTTPSGGRRASTSSARGSACDPRDPCMTSAFPSALQHRDPIITPGPELWALLHAGLTSFCTSPLHAGVCRLQMNALARPPFLPFLNPLVL